ncbi:hypothetical protein BDW22DRAFT_1356560 [Trametopsis cervina]|nr:hypothetical protein BDW22DRAFT_1356560 [Trametopsis cervina]
MPLSPPQGSDVEQGVAQETLPGQRQPSSIPSFLFISFVIWIIMNNTSEEVAGKNKWLDTLSTIHANIHSYSAWLNGTTSNFSLPALNPTWIPLVSDFVTFGRQLDPYAGSYYTNLTGFWRGDIHFHNLTNVTANPPQSPPFWLQHAQDFISSANLTNATALSERQGKWKWAHSTKTSISFGDKKLWSEEAMKRNLSEDIALIHGKIDLSDPDTSEEMRFEIEGVHFISNGSLYAFAETSENGIDIRYLPTLVPVARQNDTARLVEAELITREAKLKERVEDGTLEENSRDENPKTSCSFKFFGQVIPSTVPLSLLQELEDEINNPTGISTVKPPDMKINGLLISRNCGILYELPQMEGLKSQSLFRKITTYGGIAAIMNLALLCLLLRQVARSRSAAGLSRVSRYPFIIQSLIDAVSFVGHVTLAILAEGRTSIAVLAPAGVACILFVYEAQFAVLIGQLQGPEEVRVSPPAPAPLPQPQAPTPPNPAPTTAPNDRTHSTDATDAAPDSRDLPPIVFTPPTPTPTTLPPRPTLARFIWDHFRNDPTARMWAIMSFFLLVVFRLVIVLSIPLIFVGALYSSLWLTQIYRAMRRARNSGLAAEYLVGTTLCRLYYLLYFLGCPKNVLDIEQRPWVYGVAVFVLLQVLVILLQEYFGPTLFFPEGMTSTNVYNYHPPLPLPDPEAPEQSLGDCAICMDTIQVDSTLRQRPDEKSETHSLARHTTQLWAQSARKSYSLAPCHHLFHTACLERWLAIKNICPQCRRPLPPL